MRFDIHLREKVRNQITTLAETMKSWETNPEISDDERTHISESLHTFNHITQVEHFSIGGVDGTGDYPALTYADSFVYVSLAQATIYDSRFDLLKERVLIEPIVNFCWLPEHEQARYEALDEAFSQLAGLSVDDVLAQSDYRSLKAQLTGHNINTQALKQSLIRPHAADASNLATQLRSTAELGEALSLIQSEKPPDIVLMDGTLSLPLVGTSDNSLFYEHLKRLCCVEAFKRAIGFFALSKSHGLPAMGTIEEIAREKFKTEGIAEHWFLRLPMQPEDDWELSMTDGRRLPPIGAVSYLVRFHAKVPVMRLDMDLNYWHQFVKGSDDSETQKNEQQIFERLDFAGHDQRCIGYPYPLKAAHDRASLTQAERVALRTQIKDAAIAAGMQRTLFNDASQATGHR